MIQIEDKIVSLDLFKEHFICDLPKCEGNCCVFGDSGAPLEDDEADLLERDLEQVLPYMRMEGKRAVDEQASWTIDADGDKVTPLVGQEECAYVVFEDHIARCAIEMAWADGKTDFQKPLSCHLYPIRVNKLKQGIALNYHQWSICEPARILGKKEGLPVFKFLEGPIKRAYGESFFKEMDLVYMELLKAEKL